jgi:hypothetical protein
VSANFWWNLAPLVRKPYLFAVLFGGAVALLPAIAEDRLGVDAVGLGWLRAAIGIGAATTTLSLAVRPLERRIGPILMGCVGLFGVGTIVLVRPGE